MGSPTPKSSDESPPAIGGGQSGRGTWDHQVEFLLSCIGYAVGLSNIWRFPYLCMRNGGGSFLIPYFTCMFLCGIPLFFMELAIGQYSSFGPMEVWKLCPIFQGLGWGMIIVTAFISMYYNVIIAWVLYYLGMSFTKNLPWADCGHTWNTDHCLQRETTGTNITGAVNYTNITVANYTGLDHNNTHFVTPAEEFWENNVLQRSSGIGDIGGFRGELVVTVAVAWLLVFLCLAKGIKSSGKVVYVTATIPYIFLTILLVRGLLLPGSANGVRFYITPNFARLLQLKTWAEACLQVFYSLGPVCGTVINLASYNKFNYNCQLYAFIISFVNCGTSFFAGFVIFSIIGFMAHDAGLSVDEVITSGPGIVFMAYPDAIARMPLSPVWAVLFFIMLLALGLDSQFSNFEVPVAAVLDAVGTQKARWKLFITGALCVFFFLFNLIFVTRAGVYYFQIMDWYSSMYALTLMGFFECIAVTYIYGWRRLFSNIEQMTGRRPSRIWVVLWAFVTPITILGIISFSWMDVTEPSYGDYVYPRPVIGLGWLMAMCPLLPLPICAVHQLLREKGTLKQRFLHSLQPAPDWGPAHERYTLADCTDVTANVKESEEKNMVL